MKYLPHGTTVTINSQPIGGLISVGTPDQTRGEAETTDSASNFDRSFVPGLRDGGSVSLTFRHDPDDPGQQELESNFATNGQDAVVSCLITLPDEGTSGSDSRTYAFDGFVTAPPKGDLGLVDDAVAEQTATIRVAGAVTIGS